MQNLRSVMDEDAQNEKTVDSSCCEDVLFEWYCNIQRILRLFASLCLSVYLPIMYDNYQ